MLRRQGRRFAEWHRCFCNPRSRVVLANLRDLLGHCGDVDASVRASADDLVRNYGKGGLPCVQQAIAEAKLGLMENLLSESTEISQEVSTRVMTCSYHIRHVVRVLEKPQRQKWVSLLVRVLLGQQSCPKRLISDLELLWRADDDPSRSYAEAEQQLRAFRTNASKDTRKGVGLSCTAEDGCTTKRSGCTCARCIPTPPLPPCPLAPPSNLNQEASPGLTLQSPQTSSQSQLGCKA